MSARSPREHVAEGLILLALVAGAWLFFVQGSQSELARIEAEIARHQAEGSSPDPNDVPAPDALGGLGGDIVIARAAIDETRRRNEFGRNASTLYERIMAYARTCGVDVYRVNPASDRPPAPKEGVAVMRVSIGINSTFERTIAFIEGLHDIGGYIRPSSVIITPIPNREEYCTAELECEILQFALPANLTIDAATRANGESENTRGPARTGGGHAGS